MKILELCLVFLKIGVVGFGGGWTIVGIMQHELVPRWITLADFHALIPIAQSTPGPIALNAATLIGLKYGGIPGALLTSFSVILPPLIIAIVVFLLGKKPRPGKQALDEALRSSGIALLVFTVWSLAPHNLSFFPIAFAIAAALLSSLTKVNAAWIIIGAGLLYALLPL